VAACAGSSNPETKTVAISALLDAPDTYDDQSVTIMGTVKGASGVLGTGGYEVTDGTGTLTVLTDEGLPEEGSKVAVEGEFEAEHLIGDETLTVLKETSRRSI
jgi:hypothetical protein